mgnify:CR=1 FL=1
MLQRIGMQRKKSPLLQVTQDISRIGDCDFMLVYLTGQTWTRGEASEAYRALARAVPEREGRRPACAGVAGRAQGVAWDGRVGGHFITFVAAAA